MKINCKKLNQKKIHKYKNHSLDQDHAISCAIISQEIEDRHNFAAVFLRTTSEWVVIGTEVISE